MSRRRPAQDEYRQLLGERNERSDRLFLSLVRKWIMGLRTKDTRAAQHRLNAEENGASVRVEVQTYVQA